MSGKAAKTAFRGTAAQQKELEAVIQRLLNQKGALMPILQAAQGIYGYLSVEVQ